MAMRVPVVFKGVKEKMRGYASDEGGFEPSWPSRLPDPEATDIEVEGLEELPELPPPARSRSQSSTRSSAPSSTASPRNDSATEELELYISSVSPARSRRSSSCSSQGRKEKALQIRRSLLPTVSDPAPPVCHHRRQEARSGSGTHPSSPLLVARPSVAAQKHAELLERRHSVCRAALIRANACRFADRYCISEPNTLVGQGTFGRVYECVDKLADMKRAVKRLKLPPEGSMQKEMANEIDALIALDHPAIVRLIEYFVEDSEVLLVMELLQGPSLGEKMREFGKFSESFAVRCLRHMLKALFCCHCHGIAHNDVSEENFRFENCRNDAALRMVDFGLSEVSSQESPLKPSEPGRGIYVQKRDIWSVGTILYQMLSGTRLLPVIKEGSESLGLLPCATNPNYVPAKLKQLEASEEALDLLSRMLEQGTEQRIAAQEALQHPLVVQSYALQQGQVDDPNPSTSSTLIKSRSNRRKLAGCAPALRAFAKAPRIKRLALPVAAHLLGDEVGGVRWVFRFLARDGWLVEEDAFQQALLDSGEEVPQDFAALFRSADLSGSGALNFVEFMAAMMATLPEVYCSHSSLKAVFHFFDSSGGGVIRGEQLHSLFPAKSESECSSMIRQSCGKDSMNFGDFQRVMLPMNWKPPVVAAASWAEVPDLSSPILVKKTSRESKHQARLGCSSDPEHDAPPQAIISRVTSAPSEAFAIRQVPGFHRTTLRPFYESQAVSNVVLGLASGSSGYARRAVQLNCAELVEAGRGAFFFMPNPKYHWTPEAAFNEERKARFVAWWIHPDLCPLMKHWTGQATSGHQPGDLDSGVGAPGDFGYSQVRKPTDYLHTCRDLCGLAHIRMLESLTAGIKKYLERMFGEALPTAHVSAGFHYPVRPQYSTLHLQIRVNSGDVCPGEGRGVDLFRLQNRLKSDPECFKRDDETLFYEATANLRTALLKACDKASTAAREVGPMSLVLGL